MDRGEDKHHADDSQRNELLPLQKLLVESHVVFAPVTTWFQH